MNRLGVIIFVALCVATAACKKKVYTSVHSVQQTNPDSTVIMTATVNGQSWQTDSAFAYADQITNDSGAYNLTIVATNKTGKIPTTVYLYITNYRGPNTYNIDAPYNTATYYIGSIGNNRNFASSGQITITSDIAYNLLGTFNFTADSITVANGSFNVLAPY